MSASTSTDRRAAAGPPPKDTGPSGSLSVDTAVSFVKRGHSTEQSRVSREQTATPEP